MKEMDLDRTTYQPAAQHAAGKSDGSIITIFDADGEPRVLNLSLFQKKEVRFGRGRGNDIILHSPYVSETHGRFLYRDSHWIIEDRGCYAERPSTNGLIYNEALVFRKTLSDGDFIRIDDGVEHTKAGVLFIFSAEGSDNLWRRYDIVQGRTCTIGRAEDCDIVLPHITVSKNHAAITFRDGSYWLTDNQSTNGVILNNQTITGSVQLGEKDIISITNCKLVFTAEAVYYCCYKNGVSVDTSDVVIKRGKGRKTFITGNHVSLGINPGELVAIIGGSGAGKSTILNCMCGYLPPASGDVYINGVDLYSNFSSLKKMIGYVPQSDIVYDNLTLYDMLSYTAKLRLPDDVSEEEREQAISRAIHLVELDEKKNSFIKALSGGQRKRASIAVELLSDPNLLFLDEPASGLDPGTERNLMHSLRQMADSGKTVILVTHSTLQLQLCDKIVFMGKGGNLCFFGSYDDALKFFGIDDIVDVYNIITDHAPEWREKYDRISQNGPAHTRSGKAASSKSSKSKPQLPILCARYIKLVVNDRQRLLLLLAQAPILAFLISIVADGTQFEQCEMTKSLLFALSCSAFWVGMLNAIQEICKERSITKREYMTGLSLNTYIVSKIIVLGILCLVQSLMIIAVFSISVGLPEEGVIMHPFIELFITTFLTALSSAAMGLFVSSLFSNADRAMTVAPILLMPQILFSGLIFKLEGASELISYLAVCRWSMEGYGTTANLNSLQLKLQMEGVPIEHEADAFFEYTAAHIRNAWMILLLFVVVFLILARIVLSSIGKENG